MLFLVTSELIEDSLPRSDRKQMLEHLDKVLASMDMLAKLEADGRLRGGIEVGRRATSFVVEADSNEQLHDLIRSLPYWTMHQVRVTPLLSFAASGQRDRAVAEQLKG